MRVIVLKRTTTSDDSRVEADHRIRPIFAMASFISLTATDFLFRGTMPLMERISQSCRNDQKALRGFNELDPIAHVNSQSFPDAFRYVIWPLLVNVADAM